MPEHTLSLWERVASEASRERDCSSLLSASAARVSGRTSLSPSLSPPAPLPEGEGGAMLQNALGACDIGFASLI